MKAVQIGGLVSFTTIDYPGKLAAVLFLVGCPLRCAYCSNPHLLSVGDGEYDPQLLLEWMQARIGKLEAIVFSGGVASNAMLRQMVGDLNPIFSEPQFSTDNAMGVAVLTSRMMEG